MQNKFLECLPLSPFPPSPHNPCPHEHTLAQGASFLTWDGNRVYPLVLHPGERQLSRGALLLDSQSCHTVVQNLILRHVVSLEPRHALHHPTAPPPQQPNPAAYTKQELSYAIRQKKGLARERCTGGSIARTNLRSPASRLSVMAFPEKKPRPRGLYGTMPMPNSLRHRAHGRVIIPAVPSLRKHARLE